MRSLLYAFWAILIIAPLGITAQTIGDYQSNAATGNWSDIASWEVYDGADWIAASVSPGQNAGAGLVTIQDGHDITFDVDLTVNAIGALTVGGGTSGSLTTLTAGNRRLTITNDLIISANGTYNLMRNTLVVNGNTEVYGILTDGNNAGPCTFNGTFTINNGGSFIPANTSAFTFNDVVTIDNGGTFAPTANSSYIFAEELIINSGGSFSFTTASTYTFRRGLTNDGTFNKTGTGTVQFTTNDQEITGSQPIVMNGTIVITGITVTNNSTDLSLTRTTNPSISGTGGWLQATGSVLKFSGTSMALTVDFSTNANTVDYTRGGTQTIYSTTYYDLTVSTSGTKTLGGDITVNGDLETSGTATLASDIYHITGNATGTFTLGTGTFLTLGNTTDATNTLFPSGFPIGNISLHSASTVNYQNNDVQTISSTPTYGILTISTGGTKTPNGNLTVAGNLNISAGTLALGASTATANITGNATITGTFDLGSTGATVTVGGNATVSGTLDLGTAANIMGITGTCAVTGTVNFNGTAAKSLSIGGNLSGAGTIDMSGGSLLHSLSLGGTSNAITTFTTAAVASTVTYNNTTATTTVFSSSNYRNLVITGGGNFRKDLSGDVTVNNNLTIQVSSVLNPGANNLNVTGLTTIIGDFDDRTTAGINTLGNVDMQDGEINDNGANANDTTIITGNLLCSSGFNSIGRVVLTVNGTTTIANDASLTFTNNTAGMFKRFDSQIILQGNATWTSSTITTAGLMEFRGGIDVAEPAHFSVGIANFTTGNQNLSGAGTYSFGNPVTVTGAITLTNQCTDSISFTSTLDGTDVASIWRNDPNTVVYYQSATQPMNTGVLDVSANGNYFYYSRNAAQTIKTPLTSYYHLYITGGAGTKTLSANTDVDGNFEIAASTTFAPVNYDFTVDGNSNIFGTFSDAIVAGTTNLQNVDLSGGTITGALTGVVIINGNLTMPTGNAIIGLVDLTVSGTTTVASGRSITLNNATGTKIFIGAVTINGTGTWTSTAVALAPRLEFRGGITNNNSAAGSFAAGTATFSAFSQNLAGAGPFTFSDTVTISGAITVTNQSSYVNGITFTNVLDGNNGSSTWKNDVNSTVYYQYNGATQPMNTGVLDVSANGNYFYYSRNSTQTQNIKVPLTSYYHLGILGGTGAKTLSGNTDVDGNFSIAALTSFNPGDYDFTVDGGSLINGTFADATVAGTTNLEDVNLSGGTINGGLIGVVIINGNLTFPDGNATVGRVDLTVHGTTVVPTTRSILFNHVSGNKIFIGAVTLNGTGTWTSTTVATPPRMEFRAGITNNNTNSGSFDAGTATFSFGNQSLAGTGPYSFSGDLIISGAYTLSYESTHSDGITFTDILDGTDPASTWQSAANTRVYYQPGAATQPMNTGILDVDASGNQFHYSRSGTGTQTIKAATYHHLYTSGAATKTLQGNTTVNGNLSISDPTTLTVGGNDITVTGTSTIDGSFTDGGNAGTNTFTGLVTISATGTLSTNNTSPFIFGGGITNDGVFNKTGTGAVSFNTNNQDISGTAAMTMAGAITIGAGRIVTYKNTHSSGITISGVLNGANGSSTWVNDVNTKVYYTNITAPPMNTGLMDLSASDNTFAYNGNGSQTIKATVDGFYDLSLGTAGTKTLSANATILGDLDIAPGVTLDVHSSNHYDILIAGDWTNNGGSFNAYQGSVTFNGMSDQEITSAGQTFFDLGIDNDATQVTLVDDVTVTNDLSLIDGVLTTGSNELIMTKSSGDALTVFDNTSFVNGTLIRNIATNTDTYSFPVGNGTSSANYYRTDVVNNSLTGTGTISASFIALHDHDDADMNVTDAWISYNSLHTAGVWAVSPDIEPIGGSYDIRLYIENMGGLTDNKFAPLKRPLASISAADWTHGGGTLNADNGEGRVTATGYMLRKGLTTFSEHGAGRGDGGGGGLPIELLSFTAFPTNNNEVILNWVTATEINNDFFTIERSADGINFEILGTVNGAGNSTRSIDYRYPDKNPLKGISYYRLKQTDFDGTFNYAQIISVSRSNVSSIDAYVYPNPATNSTIYTDIKGLDTGSNVQVKVADLQGKVVYDKHFQTTPSGTLKIEMPENLIPGMYLMKILSDVHTFGKHFLVTQ